MANILSLRGFTPKMGDNVFLAPTATLIGDVSLGNDCSVWFNAVLRGDVGSIIIGNKVNIQDGVVVHCTYQKSITRLEDNISIGHNAVIHGCHIESNVLVGMGAIIMDNVTIQKNVIVAAGALITERSILESNFIYAGSPAKKMKPLPEHLLHNEIERIATNYIIYSSWYER